MSEILYPWKRFWYPRGGQISLADYGFLIDPEGEEAKYFPSAALSFQSISNKQCLILLGEVGIGKSTGLRDEFESLKKARHGSDDETLWFDLRDYSTDDRLERVVFNCSQIERWRDSAGTLHLFLDSLDEGLLRIDNISRVLLANLEQLPKERLRLRIASRPTDWQPALERGLIKIWGEDHVGVFEAAPLRRVDVTTAASLSAIDPESFLDAVLQRDAAPLANKPVTLKFLIGTFAKSKTLPASRAELYRHGCALLCQEEQRDTPITRPRLGIDQRLAIAGRIAAVTQISNRSAIWLGMAHQLEPQDVAIDSLVGGIEGRSSGQITVDLLALRETLDTGLFSSRGLSRLGWRHQSYAEFLAAYYLNTHQLPTETLRSLLLHSDGSNKVIPQLREIAAWLAGMDTRVFNLLVQSDPEVLLQSDMAVATHEDRARIAYRLLEGFESSDITQPLWDIWGYFVRLVCPQLVQVVRPYVVERSHAELAIIAAIEIIRACQLDSLQQELVSIALDQKVATRIRVHSASAIVEIGSSAARAALRPLAFDQAGEDPLDQLKGYGLEAVWPEHISPEELFSTLTPPKDQNYIGGPYREFLSSSLVQQLQPEHIEAAVAWAKEYTTDRGATDILEQFASKIIERAVDYIDRPVVRSLLATALLKRGWIFTSDDRIRAKIRDCGNVSRFSLIREMFTQAPFKEHGWLIVMNVCELRSKDVLWLLSDLANAQNEVKRGLAQAISRLIDGRDVDTFGAVLVAADTDEDLRAAIDSITQAVNLGTVDAEQMKEYYELSKQDQQPAQVDDISAAQYISDILTSKTPEAFFRIDCWLRKQRKKSKNHSDPLPGWSELEQDVRTAVIGSALEYLKTRPPVPEGGWWKEGRLFAGLVAGHDALRLLTVESPQSLAQLSDEDWDFWTRVVLADLPASNAKINETLISKVYERSKETFLFTFSDIIDGEDSRHGRVVITGYIGNLWSDELAEILRNKLARGNLTTGGFVDVLTKLLKLGDFYARKLAKDLATGLVPSDTENRRKISLVAAALLSYYPAEWNLLWPLFQADKEFGVDVLENIASGYEYIGFATEISEDQIADICIWLSALGLDQAPKDPNNPGFVTPPVALARWWNALINFLMGKGTPESCEALRRMVSALPQYPGLQHSLNEAEERTRRATWVAPKPETIFQLSAFHVTRRLVLSIHGIRTRGGWQKEINSEFQKDGFRHEILDYGFFRAIQLVVPRQRTRHVDWFRKEYERRMTEADIVPSLVAHSFGTYIVANAIEKYDELRFDRIILCGSIVRINFDWDSLIKSGRVSAVLNEYGDKDIWARIVKKFVPDAGPSGAIGFTGSTSLICQRRRTRFGHSDYFYLLNYRDNWIPFLKGISL